MKFQISNRLLTKLILAIALSVISNSSFSVSFEECLFKVRLLQVDLNKDATLIVKLVSRVTSIYRTKYWPCPYEYSIGEVFTIQERIEYTTPISSFRSGAELQIKYENYPSKWESGFVVEKLWRVVSVEYKPVSENATPIIVLGEVVNPGEYMVENRGLLNALYAAGGFTDRGDRRITVSGPGTPDSSSRIYSFRFDVKEILVDNYDDVWIPPGWSITVPNPFFGGTTSLYNTKIKRYVLLRNEQKEPKYNMELMQYYSDDEVTVKIP